MKYEWILFDADETLYSFDSYLGLSKMLKRYQIDFTRQDYDAYQAVNLPLWVAYQNKEISAHEVQMRRFAELSAKTGQPALQLNQELMAEMALISQPLAGVQTMLDHFYGKAKLGIITNGFSALQQRRLDNTRMGKYFDVVVVSEEVCVAKPDPKVFQHAFDKMGNPDRRAILMVGDTLESDILGGQNVGIDTCWVNAHLRENRTDIKPTYEIQSMEQLITLV